MSYIMQLSREEVDIITKARNEKRQKKAWVEEGEETIEEINMLMERISVFNTAIRNCTKRIDKLTKNSNGEI